MTQSLSAIVMLVSLALILFVAYNLIKNFFS